MQKIAVHTPTQKDFDKLMEAYEKKGWKWRSGERPTEITDIGKILGSKVIDSYKKNTCVFYGNNFGFWSKDLYIAHGYRIISVKEAVKLLNTPSDEFLLNSAIVASALSDMSKDVRNFIIKNLQEKLNKETMKKKKEPKIEIVEREVIKYSDSGTTYSEDKMEFYFREEDNTNGEVEFRIEFKVNIQEAEAMLKQLTKEVARYKKYLNK
jgi:hypothetical protein